MLGNVTTQARDTGESQFVSHGYGRRKLCTVSFADRFRSGSPTRCVIKLTLNTKFAILLCDSRGHAPLHFYKDSAWRLRVSLFYYSIWERHIRLGCPSISVFNNNGHEIKKKYSTTLEYKNAWRAVKCNYFVFFNSILYSKIMLILKISFFCSK